MTSSGIVFNRAVQLRPFITLFQQRGGNVDAVLRSAHLSPSVLSDPAALITGNALYRAVDKMAAELGDPYFAARAAEHFVTQGPVQARDSFAAAHTLAEFLPLAILEMDRQVSNVRYSIQINATFTVVQAERAFTPVAPIVQADAATAIIWVTLLRLLLRNDFEPSRISVTVQESSGIPPDLVPPSSIFKRKWNGVQIGFPSVWLKRPMILDWELASTDRGEFNGTPHKEVVIKWLETVCFDLIGDRLFSIEDLARRLDVHPKNLQRTFSRMGMSFQKIRDKVRREKALEILRKNKALQNEDIAEALGFSSAGSFSRAFKRWTGQSPTQYRNEQ